MRQSQHGKKPRGRGRKPHNPLSRIYDSNGPDVKIRGTASHIADKYLNLARDANSSGDRVAAENYHQHAEHYLRIIAAAQVQMNAAAAQSNDQPSSDESADQSDDDDDYNTSDRNAYGGERADRSGDSQPQPQSQPQFEGRSRRGGRRRNGARGGDQQESAQQDSAQPEMNGDRQPPGAWSGRDADAPGANGEGRGARESASETVSDNSGEDSKSVRADEKSGNVTA